MLEIFISSLVPSIIVGLVLFYWERRQKKRDAKRAEEESTRIESDLLRLDLEVATAQLSYAVAMAHKRGHANGEMESAIDKYEDAMSKFREFERKKVVLGNND